MAIALQHILHAAGEIQVHLDLEQARQLAAFGAMLAQRNQVINLTALCDDKDVLLKHLIDALTILTLWQPQPRNTPIRVLDVGTGGGVPGIPLRIACPAVEMHLLDSTGKKIAFCQEVISALHLSLTVAIHGRAEELAHQPAYREQYDLVVARAVAPLPTLVEYLLPFVRLGGRCIAMKGSQTEAEVASAHKAISALGGGGVSVHPVSLPGLDDRRALVVVEKLMLTPRLYPRQKGEPRSKPIR